MMHTQKPALLLSLTLLALILAACGRPGELPDTEPQRRATGAAPRPTEGQPASEVPVRAIGLSHADLRAHHGKLDAFGDVLRARGINMVGLNAGRLDWTYFPWPGHEERWSADVRETEFDYLDEGIEHFGTWSHVSVIVDVFVERYLDERPEAAARSATGEPSTFQVSISELVDGAYGRELLALIDHIAGTYPVDSVALTELFYDEYGFGDEDLAAYRAHSGNDDWPRTAEGAIDRDDPALGAWRSAALSRFVARAADVVHSHGKELFVDVRVGWGNLANEGRESGQDYGRLLAHADRLILWNYFGLSPFGPEYTDAIADSVAEYGAAQVIISVGLWAEEGETVAPEQLRQALQAIEASAVPNSWVTPSHMLSERHWHVVAEQWGAP